MIQIATSKSGRLILGLILALVGSAQAWGDDDQKIVRVLTSFPPTLFEPFRAEFEQRNPGLKVEILQRKTTAALASTTGSRALQADLFWASAPDAFELLKSAGRLAPTTPRPTGAPEIVAGYPVNDPDRTFLGFALSGYGLVYNPRYLSEQGLAVPETWEDLARPAYAGHIGISSPSRSGTTHLVVEALLQARGWERGWALWSAIGGNLATVTARSFGVTAGVARGRFGIGVSIDFLGRSQSSAEEVLAFVLPKEAVFAPASIAVLADAPNRAGAERFIDFVLSPAGQALLTRPDIGRLPVSPAARPSGGELRQLVQERGPFVQGRFDATLSARRYELVNILFDEMITLRRSQLAMLWRRVHVIEKLLETYPSGEAHAAVKSVRAALERPPITEAEAHDPTLLETITRVPRGLPTSEFQSRWEAALRQSLDRKGEAVMAFLTQAEIALSRLSAPLDRTHEVDQ